MVLLRNKVALGIGFFLLDPALYLLTLALGHWHKKIEGLKLSISFSLAQVKLFYKKHTNVHGTNIKKIKVRVDMYFECINTLYFQMKNFVMKDWFRIKCVGIFTTCSYSIFYKDMSNNEHFMHKLYL